MNRTIFFKSVRGSIFRGSLSQQQVDGINNILDVYEEDYSHLSHQDLAYCLATTYHETSATMQPVKEYGGDKYFFKMYDRAGTRPHVAKRLGNTQPGDGARFAGRGYPQLTGRRNYSFAGEKLGVDLINNPDLALRPGIAAKLLFSGMEEGWYTGKKLSNYISKKKRDYINARRIINGTDKARLIAGYAHEFEDALVEARKHPKELVPEAPTTGKKLHQSRDVLTVVGGWVTQVVTTLSSMDWKIAVPLIIVGAGVAAWIIYQRKYKSYKFGV